MQGDINIKFQTWTQKMLNVLELNMAGFDGQVQVLFTTVRFSNVGRPEY